ncbi:MAG: SRPBCC family protein [Nocardioides sp.]|uniref:SRPBCC family protein n=1 Tax=Nocardioides sp. TaxID=35761 RepID=UPI0039E5AA09
MDLTHRFTVPTDVEEAWAHFNDLAAVAECFPGAQVSSIDGDSFAGSVKVKLGPIALQYNGSGEFVEKDDAAHRFVVQAKGKDKRGNGTAGATVTLAMAAAGPGATDVEVLTDLSVTGKPAQFGRGVMQDVSDKLLGQFAGCLEQRLAAAQSEEAQPQEAAPDVEAEPASAEAPAGMPAMAVAPEPGPETKRSTPLPPPPTHEDAIDLGATVVPILVKAYWKQAAAVLAGLIVLRWLVRRRR